MRLNCNRQKMPPTPRLGSLKKIFSPISKADFRNFALYLINDIIITLSLTKKNAEMFSGIYNKRACRTHHNQYQS